MTPRQIKIELRERNLTQSDLARELDRSPVSISQIINKKIVSRHLMFKIAARIEKDIREVFPEYFGLPEPAEPEQPAESEQIAA